MLLKNRTALSTLNGNCNFQIDSAAKDVMFFFEWEAADKPDFTDLVTLFEGAMADISFYGEDSAEVQMNTKTPLAALVEQSQFGEGVIRVEGVATGMSKMWCGFQLAMNGALSLINDQWIDVKISNFPTTSSSYVTVYGIEVPQRTPELNVWDRITLNAGTLDKDQNIQKYEQLVIPYNSNLDYVMVTWTNGKTSRWTLNELVYMTQMQNDTVMAGMLDSTGVVSIGYDKHFIIDVDEAEKVKFVITGGGFVAYAIYQKLLADLADSVASNGKLISASDKTRGVN